MSSRRVPAILIALALAAAGPAAAKCQLMKLVELPVTMSGSKPVVTVRMDGGEARLVADSGAFFSVLTPAAAARLGIRSRPAPGLQIRGVGGNESMGVGTVKDFGFAGLKLGKADFLIGGRNVGGDVDGFLGQNMLGGVEVEYDLANGVLRLFKAKNCPTEMIAYWATKQSPGILPISRMTPMDRHITAAGKVNGQPIRVMFDTGSGRSVLRRQTAERIGIRRDGPGVVSGGLSWGFGSKLAESWIAPVDSFEIADEKIQHTRLRIADITLDDADMLIGADFFLSHRVMISSSQRRLYFTYNGGPVFHLDRTDEQEEPGGDAPPEPAHAEAATTPGSVSKPVEPAAAALDAAGYSRRGQAFMARRDYAKAIADFSKAAELEPKEARHLYDRALARLQNRQPVLGMADLGEALKLKPDDQDALLLRGELYLSTRDPARARADFDAVLRQAPNDSSLRMRIADTYVQAGEFQTAVTEYDHVIATLPRSASPSMALNNRCWARAMLGKELEKALADCDAALKKGPRTSSMLDSRGLVLLRMGQYDAAIDAYDDAIRLQPKSAWSLYGRGVAKHRKGLKAEGDADLQAAAVLAPSLAARAKRLGIVD